MVNLKITSQVVTSGAPGPAGKSAYQIAVDNGFEGTETEWLNQLLPFKGWYDSLSALQSDIATPSVGDYAYVKGATTSDPVKIYECSTDGSWSDSGRTVDTSNVQTFGSGEAVNEVDITEDPSEIVEDGEKIPTAGAVAGALGNAEFSTGEKVKNVGIDSEPTAGSENLVKSGGIQNELALGAVYDVSSKNPTAGLNNDGKWESLSALLSDANLSTLIPTSVRKGGMSIKFVQSSDNKYVEYFLTKNTWSASEADWEKVNLEEEVSQLGQYFNANAYHNKADAYDTEVNARYAIPEEKRKAGLTITYLMSYGWVAEQFMGLINQSFPHPDNWKKLTRNNKIKVASATSSDRAIQSADIIWGGFGRAMIDSLIASLTDGGTIEFAAGHYTLDTYLSISKSNVTLRGEANATVFDYAEGFSGNVALMTVQNSTGVILEGLDFGSKNINLFNSGNGFAYKCRYMGKWHTFSRLEHAVGLNTYDYLIAASDAPDKFKQLADVICTGTADDVKIYDIITSMKNAGRNGIILLSPGTFNLDSYIQMRASGVELRGCGYSTKINRVNPIALRTIDDATNCIVRGINFGTHTVEPKYSGNAWVYDCWIGGSFYHEYTRDGDITYVLPSQGIAGINTAITAFGNTGGTIILSEGTYEGSAGVQFTGQNVLIQGQGVRTVLKRTSGNDIFCNTASAKNNIVRNLTIYNTFQQNGDYPTQRYRIESCWNNGTLIDQTSMSNVIINVGIDYYYKTVSAPYALITSVNWIYSNMFEVHIHGHIVQTSQLWCDKPVSLIGHNAIIEFNGTKNNRATFDNIPAQYTQNMQGWSPVLIKDIHFLKTGCFNYRDDSCVSVQGNCWKFVNCVFENASSSPSPFDNSLQNEGAEDDNGCRRHGIVISTTTYGEACRTEFHNCIGIGSPYGFQSTRGWYISYGSPKLFNCIGYGGGIGEFGHGIISHRASDAQLFNCIAYAGKHTYRKGAGFRYQAHGSNKLVGCVGYGSNGTQLKSEGVPYSTLHTRCQEVGITDESFFYDGNTVNYAGLTIKTTDDGYNASRLALGNAIKNNDIVLTELGDVSQEGYGISLWAHNGQPKIENCKGYAGHGTNSCGIKIEAMSKPSIKDGYFGYDKQIWKKDIAKNNGNYCDFNMPSYLLTQYTPYKFKGIGITITGSSYQDRHLKIYLETIEATPQVIIDGYDVYGVSSIGMPIINDVNIPANVGLRAYFKENDAIVTDVPDNYFYFMLTFVANPSNAYGGRLDGYASPIIENSTFEHESNGLGIYTSDNDYVVDKCSIKSDGNAIATDKTDIRVFDSAIKGTVDLGITFASKIAINGSSNYSI